MSALAESIRRARLVARTASEEQLVAEASAVTQALMAAIALNRHSLARAIFSVHDILETMGDERFLQPEEKAKLFDWRKLSTANPKE